MENEKFETEAFYSQLLRIQFHKLLIREYLSQIWNWRITQGMVQWHFKTGYESRSMQVVLYDQQIHTDRTVPTNKPDIILKHNSKKWCKLIEVYVTAEKYTRQPKKWTKRLKDRNLKKIFENLKEETVPWVEGPNSSMVPPIFDHFFLKSDKDLK